MGWHTYWNAYVNSQAMNIFKWNCGGPWMWGSGYDNSGNLKTPTFYGMGHPGNSANFCYGDGHAASMPESRFLQMSSADLTEWNYVP
jgi:prepilin-type processing-associated H-X9-DG protein